MNRIVFFFIILSVFPLLIRAQAVGRQVKIGFGLDGISYIGDLSDPDQRIHRIYPGANLSIQMEGPRRIKFQLNGGFGKFSEQYDNLIPSTNPDVQVNTFVETSFFYGDLRLKYRFPISEHFHPFLTAGAGVLVFTPRDENGRFLSDASFTREPDETYSTTVPQIPVGLGMQARINPSVSLSLEYLFRYTPTDYLDNIGHLGTRKGHDFLHGLQLSMYITLSTPDDSRQPGPYYNAFLDADSSLIDSELVAQNELAPSTEGNSRDSTKLPPAPLLIEVPKIETGQTENWAEKEAEAIASERYHYYKVKKKDTLQSLADQYHVSVEGLMQVNYLSSPSLSNVKSLLIPKVE